MEDLFVTPQMVYDRCSPSFGFLFRESFPDGLWASEILALKLKNRWVKELKAEVEKWLRNSGTE